MKKNLNQLDLIAAIATAPGRGGIGVIRISAPILQAFIVNLLGRTLQHRYATCVEIVDANGALIDSGLALYFPSPNSFTGEDVLELQGHGGPVVLQRLLRRCVELGARIAEPGEFSRRAFLNNKIDLTQAEAIADLIDASTEAAAKSAARSLRGDFSKYIYELEERLIHLRTFVEATLDFPEEEIDFLKQEKAFAQVQEILTVLQKIQSQAKQGSLLRTGISIVLVGRPNVGKSSLLNRLAGSDRAIVTEIPGTTRDYLRETIQIQGIPLNIIDTAGLRETQDEIEKIGITRTWLEVQNADIVLLLTDALQGLTDEDYKIVKSIPENLKLIVVSNKIDLTAHHPKRIETTTGVQLFISAKTGIGLNLLQSELLSMVGWCSEEKDIFLARERHLIAINEATNLLKLSTNKINALELFAEDLRAAHEALANITGEFCADELLGEIFSRFCIGK